MNPADTDGRRAVYQNAAGELIYRDLAGKSKRVIFNPKLNDLQRWFPSRDFSMALYVYRWQRDDKSELLRWEIATGQETILEEQRVNQTIYVSADERWLIRWTKQGLVERRPALGGEWKSLASLQRPRRSNGTPDGKWLFTLT